MLNVGTSAMMVAAVQRDSHHRARDVARSIVLNWWLGRCRESELASSRTPREHSLR